MKKTLLIVLLLLFLSTSAMAKASTTSPDHTIHIEYFYDPTCTKCEKASPVIEEIATEYQGQVQYDKYNVKTDEGLSKGREYGIFGVPTVIIDERTQISYNDYKGDTKLLEEVLRRNIEQALKPKPDINIDKNADRKIVEKGSIVNITITITNNGKRTASIRTREQPGKNITLIEGTTTWEGNLEPGDTISYTYAARVNKLDYGTYQLPRTTLIAGDTTIESSDVSFNVRPHLSIPSIFAVGVFAGFNPCLFAILAFIASIALATTGKRRNVLYIVMAFSFGIFVTYLVFGLGLMQVITPGTQDGIRDFLVLMLVLLGLWQVYDANHLRNNEESTFRTPKLFIKITQQAAEKTNLPAAFLLGSLFSLIKAPCVGAIYLVILDMVKSGETTGMLYLAAYNLGVIIPVLIIGVAIAFGLNPEKVESFRKNKRVALRLVTGLTLLVLALLMQQKII